MTDPSAIEGLTAHLYALRLADARKYAVPPANHRQIFEDEIHAEVEWYAAAVLAWLNIPKGDGPPP